MCRIIRYDHVINLFQVCNFKYKKCLTEIEDKYDPLTKEGSLKKSFKICVGSELMEMLTADTKNHKIDGKKAPDSKDVDDKKDILKMVKSVNKPTINESEVETTPQKEKRAKKKGGVSA
ncbi:unnamed protein product [Rhizophagus irregularis]|nr:unnamed protein product [Rhizophagus irregularis]CAB5394574.1 unnamed protein product [Rhizophagus irregularis]